MTVKIPVRRKKPATAPTKNAKAVSKKSKKTDPSFSRGQRTLTTRTSSSSNQPAFPWAPSTRSSARARRSMIDDTDSDGEWSTAFHTPPAELHSSSMTNSPPAPSSTTVASSTRSGTRKDGIKRLKSGSDHQPASLADSMSAIHGFALANTSGPLSMAAAQSGKSWGPYTPPAPVEKGTVAEPIQILDTSRHFGPPPPPSTANLGAPRKCTRDW
ncbi:hypothetical protein H4R35_005392 [Dimargaris xerosporica]|nr:hypothetical protein H4R35_005392 [Dimargaris xerosporica]